MFPGLKERFSKELISLVPEGVEVKVVAPPERKYSSLTLVWISGSIHASLKTLGKLWDAKKVYSDLSRRVVYRCVQSKLNIRMKKN